MTAVREALDRFFERRAFEEAITLLVSGIAAAVAAVFALGRALSGAWIVAGIDAGFVAIAAATWIHVWRTGRATTAGRAWIGLTLGAVVAMAQLFGPPMLYWAAPLTAAAFFLFPPLPAAALAAAAAAALAGPASALDGWAEVADFYGALLTTGLLALALATSVRHDRAELSALAERDALTGARNRRGLAPSATLALQRSAGGTPAALLEIDIDHFKAVNDTYGHALGDRVLIEVTALISATVRASDDVFRYGGEELVVLAHGAAARAVVRLADQIRRRIADAVLVESLRATVSVGVAEARPEDTPASWFARADAMLYRAKQEGRNRVRADPTRSNDRVVPGELDQA